MSEAELQVLEVLVNANGNMVSAKELQEQTQLSDRELQSAMASLVGQSFAMWIDGGEMVGKSIRFHSARIQNKGLAAFAASRKRNLTLQTDKWYDIVIENKDYLIRVEGRSDDFDNSGQPQVLVAIMPRNLPTDLAGPTEPIGSPVNLNDDFAND